MKSIVNNLQTSLMNLSGSGLDGFEGLIRDAYRETTGVALRLQKSGVQHGADVVPDHTECSISVGIEAKRYRPTTSLPFDQLKKKLIDAATRKDNPIELWILAVSKEISGDDVAKLHRVDEEHGLGVLVLDWRSEGDPTAPLPLLLSLAPNTVRQHLGNMIADSLPQLHKHPEYDTQKTKLLEQLVRPDLGMTHAAKAVKEKITQTLQSRANAMAQLQSPVDMEVPSRIWVSRAELCGAIQEWKADAANTPVCAVVGEEGVGKTWLMLDWWRRETASDDPPLIVWLSARDVASGSINEVIGAALAKWISTPKRNADFWARRIELWRQTHGVRTQAPFISLMLDGVNEGTSQENVLKLLHGAVASEWKGKVSVLLSDRPTNWKSKFLSGRILDTLPKVIKVSHFSESELEDLLSKHGRARDDFSPDVLKIIRWPRWFAVAAKLFDHEHDWSAHSPEQLMIRYWQHYLRDRGQIVSLNDEAFRDFVARLGSEIKKSLETPKTVSTVELRKLLSSYSGNPNGNIMETVGDIISGIWMQPINEHQFQINKDILPFAISLALLNKLQTSATYEGADRECEEFLGPIEDQTIGVDILGAAVSLAFFVASKVPQYAKKMLMIRWINAHNFGSRHFNLMWRIAAASPDAFISAAEDIWLQRATRHSIDKILIKGIANIATDSGRRSEVIAFLAKWAGTFWSNSREGQFVGYNPTAEESAAAGAETARRLGQLKVEIGDDLFIKKNLRCCENGGGASWISHRIFAISTYLPRAFQSAVWSGWVLSRTVMGNQRHYDDLAWSLRLNPIDGPAASQILTKTVDELILLNSPILRPQVLALLEAYGGQTAEKKLSLLGEKFQTPQYIGLDDGVENINNVVQLKNKGKCSGKDIAAVLTNFATNPSVLISRKSKKQLEQFAQDFPIDDLSVGRGQTGAYFDLKRTEPALARWAPMALANLYRRYMQTLSECGENVFLGITLPLDDLLLLLPKKTQLAITAVLKANKISGDEMNQVGWSLWNAALFDRPPGAQWEIWMEIGAPKGVLDRPQHHIRPLPLSLLRNFERYLHSAQKHQRLVKFLEYLFSSTTKGLPKNCDALWQLFVHEDANIRSLAIGASLCDEDTGLAQRLYETDWKSSPEKSVSENFWGSCLLSRAASPETFENISQRIDPQCSDILWKQFGYDASYKAPFANFLYSSVERECNPPSTRTFPEYRCSPKEATRKLLEQDNEGVTALAHRLFCLKSVPTLFGYQWPRLELLRAFFEINPQQGAIYWRKMEEGKEAFTGKCESFEELPFIASDCTEANELREILIKQAKSDWDLMTLAFTIVRQERCFWTVKWIKTILANSECSGDTARAVTLAGLLDNSIAAKDLWANELSMSPLGGWIEVVYSHARQRIERGWNSITWLDRMFEAKTNERFFAFWRLFVHSVDYRVIPIALSRIEQKSELLSSRRRDFLYLNWKNVVNQTEKEKSQMEKTLFASRTGFRYAVPWAR